MASWTDVVTLDDKTLEAVLRLRDWGYLPSKIGQLFGLTARELVDVLGARAFAPRIAAMATQAQYIVTVNEDGSVDVTFGGGRVTLPPGEVAAGALAVILERATKSATPFKVEILTSEQVAADLGVPVDEVRSWRRKGLGLTQPEADLLFRLVQAALQEPRVYLTDRQRAEGAELQIRIAGILET